MPTHITSYVVEKVKSLRYSNGMILIVSRCVHCIILTDIVKFNSINLRVGKFKCGHAVTFQITYNHILILRGNL